MQLSESGAIVRHLARLHGLAGKDVAEQAVADMVFEASKNIPGIVGGWRVVGVLAADAGIPQGALTFEERNGGATQATMPVPMAVYLRKLDLLLAANSLAGKLRHFAGAG